MAHFHFCTANHWETGRATLVDMSDWFTAGLTDLGHTVTFSTRAVDPSAINVFWEYFLPGMRETILASNVVYGIVATEIPDGEGFNWRKDGEWKQRFASFAGVAERAAFIWTMVESSLPFYSQFCQTAYVELGFSYRLIPDYINRPPVSDFSFFGLRTPHREEAISRLRCYAKVEWPNRLLTRREVGNLIARSKIGINFKQSPQWPIPSPTRLGRLMMAKRGIAAEWVPVPTRQGEIVGLCSKSQDFVEHCLSMLKNDWRQNADKAFERYRSEMPMRTIMETVLDSTVLHLKPQRKRLYEFLPPRVDVSKLSPERRNLSWFTRSVRRLSAWMKSWTRQAT